MTRARTVASVAGASLVAAFVLCACGGGGGGGTSGGTHAVDPGGPVSPPHTSVTHLSCEADEGHPCCVVRFTISLPGGTIVSHGEVGRIFPEWEAVERGDPDFLAGLTPSVVLEGTVAAPEGASIAFEDTPFGHHTHDFNFDVIPDEPYLNLLGVRVLNTCSNGVPEVCVPTCPLEPPRQLECPPPCRFDSNDECVADGGGPCLVCPSRCEEERDGTCHELIGVSSCTNLSCATLQERGCITEQVVQDHIEVEWETGLGADNGGNPCESANQRGDSCGFFSEGHRRRELIWNWPTVGDRVHVEGYWIFDRGHPPARTEIHPPRLVATQRQLPAMLTPPGVGTGFVVATREDVFASGDGGAYNNDRSGVAPFVRRVPMSEKDYSFRIVHDHPRPTPSATLRVAFTVQDGDTFPVDAVIAQDSEVRPDGSVSLLPSVTVTIPWNGAGVPDTAVFARTFYLWWGTGDDVTDATVTHGVAPDYRPRLFRVTLDYLLMNPGANDMLDGFGLGDMELRMFVEASGNWLFVNELAPDGVHNVLEDGLGDAGDNTTDGTIVDRRGGGVEPWVFPILLRPGGSFRLHADGWEADGVDDVFGHLIDPYATCDCQFQNDFTGLFGISTYLSGGRDDPIGVVNHVFSCANADAELGAGHAAFIRDQSEGEEWSDDITGAVVHPDRVFRFQYHVEELAWEGESGTAPPGGPCDTTPPAITIAQPVSAQYVHSAMLTLEYSAFDVGGSGVRSLGALLDGSGTLGGRDLPSGRVIDLLVELGLGPHTFTVEAVDYLGNAGSQTVPFEIIVTPESLIEDVERFLAEGQITLDHGRPLLAKLEAAARARARGNCNVASNHYEAFIHLVQAQSGKKITEAAAQILIEDARYLVEFCP